MSLYNTTAVVKQATNAISPAGGSVIIYTTRIASMDCRLVARTLRESDSAGKLSQINFWTVFCEYNSTNAAILNTDIIVVEGKILKIAGINNAGGLLNHHLEIDCSEVV